ncbi:MAG TPA: hypothetical protein VG323_09745 [Thermoanaerobaculia bacterium]|nr:hypothetical protein [Thermoanaerobaculia bacterium]
MFTIPMVEQAVTVALLGTDPEEHNVYLQQASPRHDGAETMAEYLNSARRFFPMLCAGVPKMVNRDQILWVRSPKMLDPESLEVTLIERLTILELTDGSRLEGVVPIDRPREQSRISDVLNDATESFLRIDGEGETYYVNKGFIRTVIPR